MKNLKERQRANDDAKARRRAIARWENEGGKVLAETKKPDNSTIRGRTKTSKQ